MTIYSKCRNAIRDFDGSAHHCRTCGGPAKYADCAPVIGQVMLSGDVLCDELQSTGSPDTFVTRWLRVVEDAPETREHGTYKAGHILTLTAGLSDKDVSPVVRVRCDQCAACMIQGVLCHETGCPNTSSRYDTESGAWVKQRVCRDCGYTVDADDECCAGDMEGVGEDDEERCDNCGEVLDDCECDLDDEEHEDTDSLEDRGLTLGSYGS